MKIKFRRYIEDKNDIYSLSVDCGNFHFSKHSKDKELMEALNDYVETIMLGLKENKK